LQRVIVPTSSGLGSPWLYVRSQREFSWVRGRAFVSLETANLLTI